MALSHFPERLAALRQQLTSLGVDGFLVPMTDEFQSEYVAPNAQRLGYLSGFTGSAGFIIVLQTKAAFFTDSRYTLQAVEQVSPELYQIFDSATKAPFVWLQENALKGSRIGYDAWLHSSAGVERFKKAVEKFGGEAIPMRRNPVDVTWSDRPEAPSAECEPYDLGYAGKASADKRNELASYLRERGYQAAVVSDPASIAWLLNVRGGDVANTPLPLSRALLFDDGKVSWFIDRRKVTAAIERHVGHDVQIHDLADFAQALQNLAADGKPVLVDLEHVPAAVTNQLEGAGCKYEGGDDPCELPRALKNSVELDGIRAAHRRDGAALARFLCWLDQSWRGQSEMSAELRLASFREANNNYRGPSFDTISGFGSHGAIVHYRATRASDLVFEENQLYLLDSGGQYLDGTTDVTRTIALGKPSDEMCDRYTRVLKGHIALASIRFPEGTAGAELDVLARQFLWQAGLDYGHGTGHGVGCYLGVHEGPQGISKRNKVPLRPGMVLSNEPGYYKAGAYGIRIENLQCVVEVAGLSTERKMFGFETLTLAPIDRRPLNRLLLTDGEVLWLNTYHARVRDVLRPMLDEATNIWLDAATQPIEK